MMTFDMLVFTPWIALIAGVCNTGRAETAQLYRGDLSDTHRRYRADGTDLSSSHGDTRRTVDYVAAQGQYRLPVHYFTQCGR